LAPWTHLLSTRDRRSARLVTLVAFALAVVGLAAVAPSSASGDTSGGDPCTPPPGVTCVLDIPYLDDGSAKHTLDAYFPTDLTGRASVVVIHGGFWMQGGSRVFAPESAYLAQNGFAVFAINFARSRPAKPSWPQVRADVEAASAWVMAHAADYHGDNTRVGVLGGSSGAHLAALLDTAGPEDGVAPLTSVAWSGSMDLSVTYRKGNRAAKHAITQLLGCTPDVCPQTYADASPVTHVTGDDGSMLFFNSSDEHIPVAGAHEMNRALSDAGVQHKLVVFKGSHKHARQYECDPARVDGQTLPVIDDAVRWFGIQLSQPTVPTGTFCTAGPGS
jgi:acetyl esterase/lipase